MKHSLRDHDSLSADERAVLQLLSVFYGPTRRNRLLEALMVGGIGKASGGPFNAAVLDLCLRNLQKRGLVEPYRDRLVCRKEVVELATRQAIGEGVFPKLADAVLLSLHPSERFSYHFQTVAQGLRRVRLHLFRGDFAAAARDAATCRRQFPAEFGSHHPYQRIFDNPFDSEWMASLSPDLVVEVVPTVLAHALSQLDASGKADDYYEFLDSYCRSRGGKAPVYLRYFLGAQFLWRGMPEEAAGLFPEDSPTPEPLMLRGWVSALRGDDESAVATFEAALALARKLHRKRKAHLGTVAELFYGFVLLRLGGPERLSQFLHHFPPLASQWSGSLSHVYARMCYLVLTLLGRSREAATFNYPDSDPLSVADHMGFFAALVEYWEQGPKARVSLPSLEDFCNRAAAAGYFWLASEAAELLSRLDDSKAEYGEQAARMRDEIGVRTLVDAVAPTQPWERVLNALIQMGGAGAAEPTAQAQQSTRLVWFVTMRHGWVSVEPRQQKRTARGGWSKGRAVSLKRLAEEPQSAPPLTDQDRAVIARIRSTDPYYGGYGSFGYGSYGLDGGEALRALAGHPLVFWHDRHTQRVEVALGEPELRVQKHRGKLKIELFPQIGDGRGPVVVKESGGRIRVYDIKEDHRRVAEILGKGISVPADAEGKVRDAVGAVASRVTVHSDVGGAAETAEEVPSDPRPCLQLRPFGEGLDIRAAVRPFGSQGPAFDPGSGGTTVIAEVDGRRLQTRRDLEGEAQALEEVAAGCPSLGGRELAEGGWTIPEPGACLEFLMELQGLGDRVVAEWPEGERFRLRQTASSDAFHVRIQGKEDWFEASGELVLDDGLVLDMAKLLELLGQAEGRFLPLGDGQFLALTRAFRKRLEDLDAVSERRGQGIRFHPLASAAVQECTAEAGALETDDRWDAQLGRLKEALELDPAVPSTLEAELRPYQIEGYRWLARLAHWGAGACLADDMGLGKTLQALALILSRAPSGPTLVVAPTSVCANWEEETRRFAPTLNPIPYGNGDRDRTLDAVGPFDLVVASYGLLKQDAERFHRVEWNTLVLDEAQAIKNRATKRSQAAMGLKGRVRLITTGTPLENHLGELWNLFRFINPGLLGSHKRFTERFARPIETDGDRAARDRLKRLIAPFLLRRTKAQVLEELPPRTEILLHVKLGEKERAFYEALRLRALERVGSEEGSPGQKRMTILAEIMRLRRACCHPRLVTPEIPLEGSKLETLAEILEELRDNRHRALIFSQFVDHLALVREFLDAEKVPYQYLDGSTPSRERKRRIAAFQAGEGEVFLISLKAGGTGINLTAADYVIHLDPWWNPAVEDQASDRAHRIGQTRPVTIYRLVATGTIEDKIVQLHRLKRDLADSLLEGTDAGGKLSLDELTALLRDV